MREAPFGARGRRSVAQSAALRPGSPFRPATTIRAHAGALTSSGLRAQLGVIDLNARALVELTHLFWDDMVQRGRGGVLNVASTAAFNPAP